MSAAAHPGSALLGWTATAVFVGSYFFAKPAALRALQMFGALLWIIYGVWIGAAPVVVANVLVLSAAAWTLARERPRHPGRRAPPERVPEELGI
jgi:hypothetical protein